MQNTIKYIVRSLYGNKKKERFETILEPLQAIIQIACLSYYPIGTKLTIQNNILYLQAPNIKQAVSRWYNNDTQEDLFFLFNIFCRFKTFYQNNRFEKQNELFQLLIRLAKNGINNLIRTYNQTDKTHVLHTLQMYKNMLDFDFEMHPNMHHQAQAHHGIKHHNDNDNVPLIEMNSSTSSDSDDLKINDIFIKIADMYSQEIFNIIHNTLILVEHDPINYMHYIDGLNCLLKPINIRIKKWIDDNIVF